MARKYRNVLDGELNAFTSNSTNVLCSSAMSLLLVSTLRTKTLRNVFFVLLFAVKVVNKGVRHNSVFTFLKIRDDFKEIRGFS